VEVIKASIQSSRRLTDEWPPVRLFVNTLFCSPPDFRSSLAACTRSTELTTKPWRLLMVRSVTCAHWRLSLPS